jgi:hypothetical protein
MHISVPTGRMDNGPFAQERTDGIAARHGCPVVAVTSCSTFTAGRKPHQPRRPPPRRLVRSHGKRLTLCAVTTSDQWWPSWLASVHA